MSESVDRRRWLIQAGAALTVGAAASHGAAAGKPGSPREVLAVEDLMREHGVIRRVLLVYDEAADRLITGRGEVPVPALIKAAGLMRRFGEDYHERQLEEQHVFPVLERRGGAEADLARILKAQHDRARQITDYLLATTRTGRISTTDAHPCARALKDLVRMYQHHAATEDTLLFPAWKAALSDAQYEEDSDRFEDLEKKMFGKNGFEDAVKTIAGVEQDFGLADLSRLTAAPPPHAAS